MEKLLLPLLKKIQRKEGYVSEEAMKKLSTETNIPISKIYGVATFYSQIYTEKQGKQIIEICNSPSCYLNGSLNMIKYLQQKLNIKSGQTTKDKKFSLHIGSCIGCCDQAPAMLVNKKLYSHLTKKKIDQILKEYKSKR